LISPVETECAEDHRRGREARDERGADARPPSGADRFEDAGVLKRTSLEIDGRFVRDRRVGDQARNGF
jgi:hypothetical protein